jgi:hypothetical protein
MTFPFFFALPGKPTESANIDAFVMLRKDARQPGEVLVNITVFLFFP